MDIHLLEQIDREIALCREELAKDTIALIAIKSVRGEPMPGAPFGPGPRAVLDAVMEMGEKAGFYTREYTPGVISIGLEEGDPDLGIWIHGDVVPEGSGWNFDPYRAVEHKGYIIGRGATDNKGQLCAMFHLMKIFKKMGIALDYLPAIYVGSNEETGAKDLKDFLEKHQPPKMSLVPDDGFPAVLGGKGAVDVYFRPKKKLQGLILAAGQEDDPGKATAQIGQRILQINTLSHHSAVAKAGGNMITRLMEMLMEDPEVSPEDRPVLEFFRLLSSQPSAEAFGLNIQSETMTSTVMSAKRIDMVGDFPEILVTIRNPMGLTAEKIRQQLEMAAEQYGVELVRLDERGKPYMHNANWPVLQRLVQIANDVTGDNAEPHIMNGFTYGHMLPNAIVYGTDANVIPEDFPEGHGEAHGVDESASLDRLQRAMRIYARALLALNEMDWGIQS